MRVDLVVEPKHANLVDDQRQAIFKVVSAALNGHRHAPDDDLGEPILREHATFFQQQDCLRVGIYANSREKSM